VLHRLEEAVRPLVALRTAAVTTVAEAARVTVEALELVARDKRSGLADLYAKEAGEKLAGLLRSLIASSATFDFAGSEWPDVLAALLAPETVKPEAGGDPRVAIWGTLEARLQSVDTLVLSGLNEGSWPRRADADRFMSRMMKGGMKLQPPERRIGLAAHDFVMAMGAPEVVLTRSARSGDAPAAPSRWLQRLTTFLGEDHSNALRERGTELTRLARDLDRGVAAPRFKRPNPKPPLDARPRRYSVTEIETLRRDPYQVYARKLLKLEPLDPLARDPSAAERGTLFHLILSRFIERNPDPTTPAALASLLGVGRDCFAEAALPTEVAAVWWPRFAGLAANVVGWERRRAANIATRHVEARSEPTEIGATGVTLHGYADRIDVLAGGMADILDYKTGSSPSKVQAYTLIAPQLALEGALLMHGGFTAIGRRKPAELAYVRLKANGNVIEESILDPKGRPPKSGPQISEEAWQRLEELLTDYGNQDRGYTSRALPFREGDTEGDYDHFARVLEWSAGGDPLEFPTE
jgi:ATP-dependent helicase/nuclease subunit B